MHINKLSWDTLTDWHIAAARALGAMNCARLDERSHVESLLPNSVCNLHSLSLLVPLLKS
jgi:hypothetical protein